MKKPKISKVPQVQVKGTKAQINKLLKDMGWEKAITSSGKKIVINKTSGFKVFDLKD